MKTMTNAVKTMEGSKESRGLSVYLDSTMLIPYYQADSLELYFDEEGNKVIPPWSEDSSERGDGEDFLSDPDLPLNDKEVREFGTIRYIVGWLSNVEMITSPIDMLQFIKRYSEPETKEIKAARGNCSLDLSFLRLHGFAGVNCAHDFGLHISERDIGIFLGDVAASHVSMPGIMSIHCAKQMGCTHLATLDESLHANKDFIEGKSGIEMFSTAEELLRLLQANLIQTERAM